MSKHDRDSLPVAPKGMPLTGTGPSAALLSKVLRGGLSAAIALMLIGAFVAGVRHGRPFDHTASIDEIPQSLMDGEASGFFALGLLLLVLTPAAGVLTMLVAYLRTRKWLFAGICCFILAVMALSAAVGL